MGRRTGVGATVARRAATRRRSGTGGAQRGAAEGLEAWAAETAAEEAEVAVGAAVVVLVAAGGAMGL